ncbi:MAG TPA: asparagine synthase-related protein [Longimicrobium sp.]|nr:asparagine synthase-related protein [Longimicrobium sp.]
MSGVVGVVNLDGAPVDGVLMARMVAALAFRAPDGLGTWMGGVVALGHSLLAQPGACGLATLDGRVRIAADVRLDARGELVGRLRDAGRSAAHESRDAELVLHAYHAWGEGCVEHLRGDFAFAIWDGARLFCARDHFGIRPFHYAVVDRAVVVGNTLDSILLHPAVSRRADDRAVADYLLFGWNRDPGASYFRDVHTLAPAHTLVVERGRVTTARYWSVPLDAELRHRRPRDYLDHFEQLFGEAVSDRMRGGRASLFMSGGRDSTAIAAAARGVPGAELRAHTSVYDRLIPDEERRYSSLAARALGISIEHHPVDAYRLFERWDDPALARPQPQDGALAAIDADVLRRMRAHGSTALTGFGADAALYGTRSRLVKLVAGGRPGRALREAVQYARWHRRIPRPGVRSWLRDRSGAREWTPPFPGWLRPEIVDRLGLRAAWEYELRPAPSPHPLRPEAHARVSSPFWARLFEAFDPGVTRVPVQVAHPFMDVRVVSFLLSVPPAQWYNDKGLLRMTMRGRLPAEFLRRQKTPLAGDPVLARLREWGPEGMCRTTLARGIERWVDPARLPRYAGGMHDEDGWADAWLHLRPLALSIWLERMDVE